MLTESTSFLFEEGMKKALEMTSAFRKDYILNKIEEAFSPLTTNNFRSDTNSLRIVIDKDGVDAKELDEIIKYLAHVDEGLECTIVTEPYDTPAGKKNKDIGLWLSLKDDFAKQYKKVDKYKYPYSSRLCKIIEALEEGDRTVRGIYREVHKQLRNLTPDKISIEKDETTMDRYQTVIRIPIQDGMRYFSEIETVCDILRRELNNYHRKVSVDYEYPDLRIANNRVMHIALRTDAFKGGPKLKFIDNDLKYEVER